MCLCAASWTAATSLLPPRWRRRWSPSNQRSAASATTKEPRSCWRIWTSRHFLCQRIRDCDLICSCKWECFQEVDTSWNTMVWFQSLMEKWTQVCVRIVCGNNQIKDKVKLRENRLNTQTQLVCRHFFQFYNKKITSTHEYNSRTTQTLSLPFTPILTLSCCQWSSTFLSH